MGSVKEVLLLPTRAGESEEKQEGGPGAESRLSYQQWCGGHIETWAGVIGSQTSVSHRAAKNVFEFKKKSEGSRH